MVEADAAHAQGSATGELSASELSTSEQSTREQGHAQHAGGLIASFLAGDSAASALFGGAWPGVPELARKAVEQARRFPLATRQALAAIVDVPQVADPDCVLVVAGQQPAVGGGPLYTLIKAAQACALAAALRTHGVAALPLFWCASEDHDLGEADHADLLARDGRIHRVRAPLGPGRSSLRFRRAEPGFRAVMAALATQTDGVAAGLGTAFLRSMAPEPDEGLGAHLVRLLRAIFARQRLIAVEAHQLRPLFRDCCQRLIRDWPTAALASQRALVLAADGRDALGDLSLPPCFRDDAAGRSACTPDEALALLADHSQWFSPGAALRPIAQQAALPAIACIVGPSELAYHALLGPLYAKADVLRPQLVPRTSCTVLPAWWRRAAAAWGLPGEAWRDPGTWSHVAGGPADVADDPALGALDAALQALRAEALPGELTARASRTAPLAVADDRARRLATGLHRLTRERARLAASLARGAARAAERPPLSTLRDYVRPRQQPQDRVMCLLQAIAEHGPGLAEALVTALGEGGPSPAIAWSA